MLTLAVCPRPAALAQCLSACAFAFVDPCLPLAYRPADYFFAPSLSLIVVIGHGVQGTPNGYVSPAEATAQAPETSLAWTVWAPEGTTWTQGMSAMLNIACACISRWLSRLTCPALTRSSASCLLRHLHRKFTQKGAIAPSLVALLILVVACDLSSRRARL
jgi:hypothetical protein